jgi:hypothetical protein
MFSIIHAANQQTLKVCDPIKISSFEWEYIGLNRNYGICYAEVLTGSTGKKVVVIHEVEENEGPSVTNSVKEIINQFEEDLTAIPFFTVDLDGVISRVINQGEFIYTSADYIALYLNDKHVF